jgi:hypothetical protein
VWGRSLVLQGPARERLCATLLPDIAGRGLKVAPLAPEFIMSWPIDYYYQNQ